MYITSSMKVKQYSYLLSLSTYGRRQKSREVTQNTGIVDGYELSVVETKKKLESPRCFIFK